MADRVLRRSVVALLLAGTFAFAPAPRAAESGKFGVVDFQRCLNESRIGKKYKAEFAAKAQQAQADLEKKEAALKELRDALEKQSLILSPAAKAEKEREYRDKLESFKEQFKASQQALQKQDQELTSKITKDLQAVVREIGESGGYAAIVERQEGGVVYLPKEADLTDEVIRRYDQRAKTEERK
jgi:outer membrane protein